MIIGQTVLVCGCVCTVYDPKTFAFIEIIDGSSFSNFQVIANSEMIKDLSTGAAIAVLGEIVKSPGNYYPLQKRRHSFDFSKLLPISALE